MKTIVRVRLIVALCVLAGCSESGDPGTQESTPLPQTSSAFRGSYSVPVALDLTAAAILPVDPVEWTVASGTVTLRYNLPVGFTGGTVTLEMSGTISPDATAVSLAGAEASAHCEATGTEVSCTQMYSSAETLPVSMRVVDEIAAENYVGPVLDRERVATTLGALAAPSLGQSDPIGIVKFDVRSKASNLE